jgi:hypothetical protein
LSSIEALARYKGINDGNAIGSSWMFFAKSSVGEHFRHCGQSSGHYARVVPAVDHRVADLSSGDNETNVAALRALHF